MSSDDSSDPSVSAVDRIVVIGTGFIGLPLALQLAYHGKTVVGVDINENIVRAINDRTLNLDESELNQLLNSEAVNDNLHAQTEPTHGDAFVISVPTPLTDPNKSPDLTHLEAAVESVLPHLESGDLINIESTVPPLTCESVVVPLLKDAGFEPGTGVQVTHSPERILPGNVFREIVENDRIIGGINSQSTRRAEKIYEPFHEGSVYRTDLLSAELCKLMENTFRDVNVALANEFGLIGEDLGIDIGPVIELANNHPRVDILNPGIGVGGHCLPVDPWFLNEVDPVHTNLITTARRINDKMPDVTAGKIRRLLASHRDPSILALGAAYKPGVNDVRNSPAVRVVELLNEDGYDVMQYDRHVDDMGYSDLGLLLREREPDVVIQLVQHDETSAELDALAQEEMSILTGTTVVRFEAGKQFHPAVKEY